ncbi:hypothetical protein I7I53_11157 [Histoplasma capsulatum var. duboisii H88]|uniref:Uncharacterized protein n=1 Tax=Ajellomyces capsulatus (strain H88) TaxID=544711 RepID=A0A8A1LEP2_AJEC8|nr:hypothetical protein I7I53_11157 [Histoplasma capsulatum var. duboisii H88]
MPWLRPALDAVRSYLCCTKWIIYPPPFLSMRNMLSEVQRMSFWIIRYDFLYWSSNGVANHLKPFQSITLE